MIDPTGTSTSFEPATRRKPLWVNRFTRNGSLLTQILQQFHYFVAFRPQIHFCEWAIVGYADFLTACIILAGHNVEPMRLWVSIRITGNERFFRCDNLILWIMSSVWIKIIRSFIAHCRTENCTARFQHGINGWHTQISTSFEFMKRIRYVVMHGRHFGNAIPQEFGIVVNAQEPWNVQFVNVEFWIALNDDVGYGFASTASRWDSNSFHASRNQVIPYLNKGKRNQENYFTVILNDFPFRSRISPQALRQESIYSPVKTLRVYWSSSLSTFHSVEEHVLRSLEATDRIDPSQRLTLVCSPPLPEFNGNIQISHT